IAPLHIVALADGDVPPLGDHILDRLLRILGGTDDDPPLGLVVATELDPTLHLVDDGEVLGLARLEQLGDARQTTRDVAGLHRFARDAGEHVAGADLLTVVHAQDRIHGHEVPRLVPVRGLDHLAVLGPQCDPRLEIRTPDLLTPVDHDPVRDAGGLVHHLAHGYAFDQVDVVGDTLPLGDDRKRIGIPFRELLTPLDLGPLLNQELGAVGQAVTRPFPAAGILQHDLGVPAHHDRRARRIDDDIPVVDLDRAVLNRLDAGLLRPALRRATDVERAHRELRTRLADRLGGDNPDRLADIDRRAAREIAAVALAADADRTLAGQDRPDLDRVDPGRFDPVRVLLVDQLAGRNDDLVRHRVDYVQSSGPAENALPERLDHIAALDHRPRGQALARAAVLLGDDAVL